MNKYLSYDFLRQNSIICQGNHPE
ncbi:MAG: hypothetical protein IJI75_03560 [Solobacterium sp.]|nr:hypothetical protein [Solobacterium sp.]